MRVLKEEHQKVLLISDSPLGLGRLLSPLFDKINIVKEETFPPTNPGDTINLLSNLHLKDFTGVCNPISGLESPSRFFRRQINITSITAKRSSSDPTGITHPTFLEKLTKSDYKRVGTVCEVGDFAVRGGILDVFPQGRVNPVRIEFYGDDITSIREFDVYTQRSIRRLGSITIPPNNIFPGHHSIMDYTPEDLLLITDIEALRREKNIVHIGKDGFDVGAVASYVGDINLFREKLDRLKDFKIFMTCEPYLKKEMGELFTNASIIPKDLVQGFILKEYKIAVFTTEDIFGYHRHKRRRIRTSGGAPIEDLEEIMPGDYVVHSDFGIGIYSGIERITIDNIATDCLLINYRDNDKLYLPISQFKCVEKYIGNEGAASPRLSKLGGDDWLIKKQKAKEDIERIIKDLLLLYAERNIHKGYTFSPDTVWQKELEASFPYDETPDQLNVMDEVKKDMENERPMDRLICGDVGFGKTEIAIRASMKSVMDGKQVAVLVPTTILAIQHLETFKKRLYRLPIRVEQLSSLVTGKIASFIKRDIGKGKADIIIGTHSLLRSKILWKDLGLLIIDEEHRFGVRDKERIKMLKKGVDVLSLSATPIPRTLYQSLQGIKTLSQLTTPPQGRLPIATRLTKWDDEEIRHQIESEIQRGGQVYFVHNEIKTIKEVGERLGEMLPGVRIIVAHGRLPKKQLEDKMISFLLKDADLLLTTTIIGSGIDITNVNTIIINRADKFGLADLHQLRGRVGRGDRQAFCSLIIDERASANSLKRLRAFSGFTELGAGIRLAMRDLEIRGAGNLLGAKQHGHARNIGYGLYLRLIEETAKILRGERIEETPESIIDLRLPAYFPDSYVDSEHKIGLYKRLGKINTITALDDFCKELKDRFGQIPREVQNLIYTTKIRIRAEKLGISRIKRDGYFLIEWDDSCRKALSRKIKSSTKLYREYKMSVEMKNGKTKITLDTDITGLETFLREISHKTEE